MAFVAVRASVACLAWLAAVAGGAAQTVSSGPAIVIDIGKAPRIPNPPMPPIYFDRPTPIDHGAMQPPGNRPRLPANPDPG